jgi:hypothetical protein
MVRWDHNAAVCYVYLCDTPPRPDLSSRDYAAWEVKFKQSAWFTRGWTLQEMIAPPSLPKSSTLASGQWQAPRRSLARAIKAKTGVPCDVLATGNLSNTSPAQRMSWAAHRQATRSEDMAYCLLGIVDIKVPMLYGEGDRAFIRLQKAIMKTSDGTDWPAALT